MSVPEPVPAESDNAENEDIEDKEAEANELFEFKAKFREDVEVFLKTAEENWNKESFKKAVLSFGKKFAKLNRANENTKVRAYYDFGDSRSKNSNEIKVGTQHRSRRANKHRGSGVSQYGRPPLKRRNQMLLTEDEDDAVFVSAPSAAKPAKKARKHSLKQAKEDNRPSAKKH